MFTDTVHRSFVEQQLIEDRAHDDVTARLLGEAGRRVCAAALKSRVDGVFAGQSICSIFQDIYRSEVTFTRIPADGDAFSAGDTLVEFSGPFATCLSLERTLLNFLGHLCGVATLTRHFVDAVKPHPVRILATRKTLPGLREFQLGAVVAGGGCVHRRSLSDGILIKENHQSVLSPGELLTAARKVRSPLHAIEIEVQDMTALRAALDHAPDIIMLDNFKPAEVGEAVKLIAGRARIEVSGGINLGNVKAYAGLGVDYISVGALTHSAPQLDLGLDLTAGGD